MRSTVHAALLLGASLVVPGCGAPLVAIPDDASAGMDALADAADARLSPDATSDASDGGACAAGCLVLATCHADGALNPANACEICDVAVSRTAFSPNDGRACDDGAFCTTLDTCVGRVCGGTARNCEDGIACNGVGTCDETTNACAPGTLLCVGAEVCDATSGACVIGCSGCVVASTCYGNGQASPLNPCERCDVARSTTAFSPNDGGSCDDGLFCTSGDLCVGTTCTAGAPRCSDGVDCNGDETCDEEANRCVPASPTCGAGQICDVLSDTCVTTCTGCVVAGACFGADQRDPTNQCQICDPAASTTAFTINDAASCDDGLFCTIGDVCTGAVCGGTARDCDDGVACDGIESCRESANACVAGTSTCAAGTLCSPTSDSCVATCSGCAIAGNCFGAGQVNPTNACEVCVPTVPGAWSANDGARCDDGLFCTDGDICATRSCSGAPRSCSDGVDCDGVESCDEGLDLCRGGTTTCTTTQVCDIASDTCVTTCSGCTISGVCYAIGTTDPTNRCLICDPTQSRTSFTPFDGASCDDGLFCTRGDVCSGGICVGSSSTNFCADAVTCNGDETCNETTDSCMPGGTTCALGELCDAASNMCVTACTGCVIGSVCYAPSSINPSNQCQVCRTSARTVWSANTGGACDDGLFCTSLDRCTASAVCRGTDRACSDGVACNGLETCNESTERCDAGASVCPGGQVCDPGTDACIMTCAGCIVSGVCYAPNTTNPSNACQVCRPGTSTTAWTAAATGTPCDDGFYCTIGDACTVAAVCVGPGMRGCGDGVTCNGSETCNESTDRCDPGTTTCGPGEVCDPRAGPGGTCVTTCSATVCGTSCINTANDPNNCGGCGMSCGTRLNAVSLCGGTPPTCFYVCQSGFLDCNGGADGCEVTAATDRLHCGTCGRACATEMNAEAPCAASACGVLACTSGFFDCDGDLGTGGNGCETAGGC